MLRTRLHVRSAFLRLGWSLTAYAFLTSWSAAQVGHERIGIPLPAYQVGGERFPAVNIVAGENVRVVVSNVVLATAATTSNACPLIIRFFDANGALVGGEQAVGLIPGASASVSATPQPGLIRATVSVANFSDSQKICAVKTSLEVFGVRSDETRILVPSGACLGNGACSAPMAPP